MNRYGWEEQFATGKQDAFLNRIYAGKIAVNKDRYLKLLKFFEDTFGNEIPGEADICLFSAPGRTEIGGNHTDHQHGRVLAASVDMDMIAAAAITDDGMICIQSEGYPMSRISLDHLKPIPEEIKNRRQRKLEEAAAKKAAKFHILGKQY